MEQNTSDVATVRSARRWWIVVLLALSYMMVFTQRTGPGLITNQLQAQFHVSAAVLGAMASVQYLLYMLLQIPVGMFADKMGPERLFITGVLLDGVGTLVFTHSSSFSWLLVGRGLVGFGDALIWVNIVLILARRFFPSEFASLLGIVGTAGNLGALLTTIPFAAWISVVGWQIPFTTVGIVLCALASADYLGLIGMPRSSRNRAQTAATESNNVKVEPVPMRRLLADVVRDRNAWATFACHFGVMGTYIGFMSVWAIPYFMSLYGVTRFGATWFTLTAVVGAMIGGPLTGAVSDKLHQRKLPYLVLQGMSTLAWLAVPVAGGKLPVLFAYLFMFIIGFGCGGSLLTFAVIRDQTPAIRGGATSGFANSGGFLSAVMLPVLFGLALDLVGASPSGKVVYSNHVFAVAFIVPTVFSAIGVLGCLGIYEVPRTKKTVQSS